MVDKNRGAEKIHALTHPKAMRGEIAAACGVTAQAVSQWASGAAKPGPDQRAILAERYGIDVAEWDRDA